uniref:Large ribosomal subunit protein mL42 n=1 Tax=Saccoglossus kowalevskii TaxID=10224 RepID=A0ABM0MXC3_SACKO
MSNYVKTEKQGEEIFDGVHRLGFIRWYSSVNTNPEIVVSKDGQMVVCYHPSTPFPYEHSRPLPRPDPARPEETHENVLKKQFVQYLHKERAGPDEKELAKMFHTTKHRWYP